MSKVHIRYLLTTYSPLTVIVLSFHHTVKCLRFFQPDMYANYIQSQKQKLVLETDSGGKNSFSHLCPVVQIQYSSLSTSHKKPNRKTVRMAEDEVNYSSVVFKPNQQQKSEGKLSLSNALCKEKEIHKLRVLV